VPVVILPWDESLDRVWRGAVLEGIRTDVRWCACTNASRLRFLDAAQTWSRRYIEFDLSLAARDRPARAILWTLVRAEAMSTSHLLLDRASELSARHGIAVCKALGDGVLKALALLVSALSPTLGRHPARLFDQSLTVLYRVLFLLFAEARGLVPMWHPVYRERYTIDAIVTTLLAAQPCRGIWRAVLAISRLAHAGCSAGELKVTPFNGRLFAPGHAVVLERTRIDDGVMAAAIMAVGTTASSGSRTRISYTDLDVEQVGAVYERVLDYEPTGASASPLARTGDARRSTGSFYTPRSVTSFLVRRALEPLIRDRTAAQILELRVLDPAMGSGAFLVAACRFLASAVEERLVLEGRWHENDVDPADRASLRREVAQRCLYGVDLNPMAVQLARLSIWLASLASDKPLTFLDHHLVAGNSLIGASVEDVWRQPTRSTHRSRRPQPLPLFTEAGLGPVLGEAVRTRLKLTRDPDDSAALVHAKEKTLAALHAPHSPLGRWSAILDLWCAGWFWDDPHPPDAALFGELMDRLTGKPSALPVRSTDPFLERAAVLAARSGFFHWRLAFPEVFMDGDGQPRPDGGFDAIIGNPPWDMVRGDSGSADVRSGRRAEARQFVGFTREAGVYRVESRSHVNRYQLFVERALQLARPGGRIGLVLPSGMITDTGAAPLRHHLFSRATVDAVTGLDNRGAIFAIHRSLRFVLLTATTGGFTDEVACRFGVRRANDLEMTVAPAPVVITRRLLERLSGPDDLAIPELATRTDLRILEKLAARMPWLGATDGWNVRFGRELNATDDKAAFMPSTGHRKGRPVLEGKQIEPFRVSTSTCRYELAEGHAARGVPRRPRLAYRDIASATNRLTLIAAIVPPRAVTTHTLFCLKTPLPMNAQRALCALMNSFVANYVIRMRVNTHVTVALVSRLPTPLLTQRSKSFAKLAHFSRILATSHDPIEQMAEYTALQALVGRLYGLTIEEFEHILSTFPLIPAETRARALSTFCETPDWA
jgi:hypothetical protein